MKAMVKISWIVNQKAREAAYKKRMQNLLKKSNELTILCDVPACIIFYSPDDKKVVTWPSQEEAKYLFDKYFSLPPHKRNVDKNLDPESFINEKIKMTEKKLAATRKVITEYEMDDLMLQLQEGRTLDGLTNTEVSKLINYSNNKIMSLRRELDYKKHGNQRSVNELLNVESVLRGNSSKVMGSKTIYYIHRWLPLDETLLPLMEPRFKIKMEQSNEKDVETSKWYPGESGKSGCADDA